MLCFQLLAQLLKVRPRNAAAEHLSGGCRKLVSFVNDQCAVIGQKRLYSLLSVYGICQQIMMIAKLDKDLLSSGSFQILMIPAQPIQRTVFRTYYWYTDLLSVKAAET